MSSAVHYEVYIRKTAPSSWSLLMATENRTQAVHTAEDVLADNRAVAARVTRETLDPDTMAFTSQTIFNKGLPEEKRRRTRDEEQDAAPRCNAPQDLYAPPARELLGRVLEDWLGRHGVTIFELLHRPDLAERLEASGVELQHAIQKIAVPESQSLGQSVHELVRRYQKLTHQAIERLIGAARRGQFADLSKVPVADVAHRLAGAPDRAFFMGGAVAHALAGAGGPRVRLDRLMDIVDGAPPEGPPRALVLVPVEQILCELLSSRLGLSAVLGPALDQGAALAAVVRMAASREIDLLARGDARLGLLFPVLEGPAARLGQRLQSGEFPILAAALARLVLRELTGPRRLRPSDAVGEIDMLRALATGLTAAAGRLLTLDEIQTAFIERSRALVTADFVAAYVDGCGTVMAEVERLTRLCENVTGVANKRAAARWLVACLTSLRFETELRQSGQSAAQRLAVLARMQHDVRAAALSAVDQDKVLVALGAAGDALEAAGKIVHQVARAPAPPIQKLAVLLRLAAGETAPLGPAADRARAEAVRLLRAPETRAAITQAPEAAEPLRPLIRAAGLAA